MNTPPPSQPQFFNDVPVLTEDEVTSALKKCSNSSTPGPDQIPYSTWKIIHRINPSIIPDLLTPLLTHGHHPIMLKVGNGIVLPKPSKLSFKDPSSFCVIVLLETISKILERIITFWLNDHLTLNKLIYPNQEGSLPGLSVNDDAITLIHEIKLLQASQD
jgi:hypothetical protein